jgi:hypothetical protein
MLPSARTSGDQHACASCANRSTLFYTSLSDVFAHVPVTVT